MHYKTDNRRLLTAAVRQVCRRADECFSSLSEQLGDRHWFLGGSAPTSLDARVFGLLAPLLRAPLPSHRLQGLLKGYPNLVTFVGRLQQKFFVKERDGEPAHL